MAAKKKKLPPRIRQGAAGIPVDSFEKAKHYIHYDLDKKPIMEITKPWIKKNFSKEDSKAILAKPDYYFHMYSHYATGIYWENLGLELPERWVNLFTRMREFYATLIESGKKILAEKSTDDNPKVVVLTPQQRMINKINNTILDDLDQIEDEWINHEKTGEDFDIYNRMRFHELKGPAVSYVRNHIDRWLLDYSDAYNKTCEQAVEGYSHIERKELKRRIKLCEKWLADLDKFKEATKAVRKARAPKVRSADKQVAKVKYQKEDNNYKLVSIPPMNLVGAMRVFTFNTKTRVLTEYVTNSATGFEVSGTTMKKFDTTMSRATRLRKPDDIVPDILKKTPKQIDNIFKSLTTKISVPNGRLNEDTILLRAMDK